MNDVPLVKDNNINSINTSLIAVKKQLKQLTEAVGLIDVPDVDTSVFVKKSEVVDEVALNNMHSVTSNAVAEALNDVSELKTLRDDEAGVIKYRTLGKIIIFSIHSKYTGIMSVSLSDANITCASFSEGMKTSLCWGGYCVGEAYISQDGTGIVANMPSSANGSGQIITFLA